MDRDVERRTARRFSMMLPLRVRFTSEETVQEQQGETRDVSFRGLYFTIEAALENDAPIEFVPTVPTHRGRAGEPVIAHLVKGRRRDASGMGGLQASTQ